MIMKEYVEMSLEDAKKIAKKDAIVLVAKQYLENQDCNIEFKKKRFGECHNILEEAATIAKVCDDFANQLRVFYLGGHNFVYYLLKSNICSGIIKNRKQPICFKRCWRTSDWP